MTADEIAAIQNGEASAHLAALVDIPYDVLEAAYLSGGTTPNTRSTP